MQAACFVQDETVKVSYEGPKNKDKMFEDPSFVLRKGVKVQTSRIIRIRPMIPTGWSITFTLEYDESILNEKSILKAMNDAGALIGLGDWRPKFGRFVSEVI